MPDDPSLPEWLRGKTPSEVAQLTTQLANAAASAYRAAPPAPPAHQPTPSASDGPPDPQLNYSDPVAYAQQLNAYYERRLQQERESASIGIMSRQAETEKHLSRGGAMADVWRRWEPEIEAELAGIPLHERNRLVYDKAAEIVRGRHWQDYVREESEKLAAAGGAGTERVGGGGYTTGIPAADPIETFLASEHPYAKATVANGVKAHDIRAHCAMMKISPEEWLQNAQAGQLIANANAVSRSFE